MKSSALVLLLCLAAAAEDPVKTNPGEPQTHMIVRSMQSDVVVDVPQDLMDPLTATTADIQIKFLPSGKEIPVTSIDSTSLHTMVGSAKRFVFVLAHEDAALPAPGDKTYEITVRNVTYAGSAGRVTIQTTGTVYDSSNIKTLVDATSQALSSAKTTEEKNLFAGLNIAVPNNTGGGVQGDLVFNQSVASLPKKLSSAGFADSGSFGAKLKKGSESGKDPRHFSLGFNLRKTVLFASKADLNTLKTATDPGASGVPNDVALRALGNVRSHFWRAFLADYGFQMEGDVSDHGIGNVSNAIFDLRPQIATAAAPVFGNQGYLTLRLMPAGFEFGHNITNSDNTTKEIGGVSRLKAGVELSLFYQNKTDSTFINRVELTGASIYRRLFMTESAFDATTQKNINTTKGDKLWTQVDFKIFVGPRMGKIRPGLKATYQRGYLPPVFSRTKVFSYGLVFESTDGSN